MKAVKKSLLALGALIAMPLAAAHAETLVLDKDEIKPLTLPVPAGSIIVGNSTIADMTMIDRKLILLTGKNFGQTQMSVLDRDGNVLFSSEVVVADKRSNRVIVSRAGAQSEYTCAPNCRLEPNLTPQVSVPGVTNGTGRATPPSSPPIAASATTSASSNE